MTEGEKDETPEDEEEQKEKKEVKEEKSSPDYPEEAQTLIDKANDAADALNKATKKHEEVVAKLDKRDVEKTLSGKAEAGQKHIKETDEEYTDRVVAGDVELKDYE